VEQSLDLVAGRPFEGQGDRKVAQRIKSRRHTIVGRSAAHLIGDQDET
jgi:hypothetical protein